MGEGQADSEEVGGCDEEGGVEGEEEGRSEGADSEVCRSILRVVVCVWIRALARRFWFSVGE